MDPLHEDRHAFLRAATEQVAKYLSERKMFRIKAVERNETWILCPTHFLSWVLSFFRQLNRCDLRAICFPLNLYFPARSLMNVSDSRWAYTRVVYVEKWNVRLLSGVQGLVEVKLSVFWPWGGSGQLNAPSFPSWPLGRGLDDSIAVENHLDDEDVLSFMETARWAHTVSAWGPFWWPHKNKLDCIV